MFRFVILVACIVFFSSSVSDAGQIRRMVVELASSEETEEERGPEETEVSVQLTEARSESVRIRIRLVV